MTAVGAFAAVLTITAMLPSMAAAQGNLVDDLLKGLLGGGGNGAAPAGDAPAPQAGTPPNYTPPLHGGNPHGQGTVGVIDLSPSSDEPQASDPADGDEEVVIGDSQGEQNGDQYHGRATALFVDVLGLINTEALPLGDLLSIETNEGESKDGATEPLNDLLDTVCTDTGSLVCLNVLDMHSETNANGSQNSFTAADLGVTAGPVGISATAADSNGNISDDGVCQTATGDSSVANAEILTLGASALNASSTSTACNNGTPSSTTNDSEVLNLNGVPVGIPIVGCAEGTPNTVVSIPIVADLVCNADDTNGTQTSSPYGVREALTAFVLPILGSPVKAALAGPESHAVAPAVVNPPDTPGGPGPGNNGGGNNGGDGDGGPGDGDDGGPGGPATTTAQPGDGQLAFTGSNLLVLGLLGGALVLGGVAIAATSGRRGFSS
jgi:hypothetical protein